jgi:hypothetical protein
LRPGLRRRSRENGDGVDGDRRREDTGPCQAGSGYGGDAQGAERGSRGGAERRGDGWPWRAPADTLRRVHAVPVAPGRRGRVLAWALWSTFQQMEGNGVFRGSRRVRETRWLGLEVRGEGGWCPW